ncbi:MAG TPA: multidrug effflux MFS transporter [Steroidobacteraceae bacterium]|nr:multidrug effflux MFS transporter [Steroidobacteraceae bacterium]
MNNDSSQAALRIGAPPSTGAVAGRPPWPFILMLAAMSAMGPLSIDMCLPSLLSIEKDFHAVPGMGAEVISVFFGGLAVGQLAYGPASDRLGRRGPLLFGYAVYTLASLACAFAPSADALLWARLAQALGGCASMVIARAVVRDLFDHHESAHMFSLLALITGAAPILAPLIGSQLLRFMGWRAIFVLLAGFGAAIGLAVLWRLPESRSESVARRARTEHPLQAYAALFAKRRLVGYLLAGALNSACIFTYISLSSGVLIGVYGLTPTLFGLVFGVNSIGLISASYANRLLLQRFRPDQILAGAGTASALFALVLAGVAASGVRELFALLVPLFCTIASSSLIQANALAGALAVDATRVGSAAALFGAGGFGVGALASTVAGALHDGTPRPMAFVIACCLMGCALSLHGLALRHRAAHPA